MREIRIKPARPRYGGVVNERAFTALVKDWGIDVVRLALHVGEGGYASDPSLKELVVRGVELEQLPGSVQWVMGQREGMVSQEPVAATLLDRARLHTSWVLQGSKQILLQIETEELPDDDD